MKAPFDREPLDKWAEHVRPSVPDVVVMPSDKVGVGEGIVCQRDGAKSDEYYANPVTKTRTVHQVCITGEDGQDHWLAFVGDYALVVPKGLT